MMGVGTVTLECPPFIGAPYTGWPDQPINMPLPAINLSPTVTSSSAPSPDTTQSAPQSTGYGDAVSPVAPSSQATQPRRHPETMDELSEAVANGTLQVEPSETLKRVTQPGAFAELRAADNRRRVRNERKERAKARAVEKEREKQKEEEKEREEKEREEREREKEGDELGDGGNDKGKGKEKETDNGKGKGKEKAVEPEEEVEDGGDVDSEDEFDDWTDDFLASLSYYPGSSKNQDGGLGQSQGMSNAASSSSSVSPGSVAFFSSPLSSSSSSTAFSFASSSRAPPPPHITVPKPGKISPSRSHHLNTFSSSMVHC